MDRYGSSIKQEKISSKLGYHRRNKNQTTLFFSVGRFEKETDDRTIRIATYNTYNIF